MFIEIHTANAGKSYLYDKMARYGRSRSSKLIQIESAYAISYWSCTATTLICLCSKYRFPDTAIYWSKICVFFVVFLSCRVSFETVTVTRLQAVQNAAARLVTGARRRDHMSYRLLSGSCTGFQSANEFSSSWQC